jgi:hypothetical protein
MGTKGDRAAKEPQAMRLYADGYNLAEISKQLDISDTTLRRWKSESGVPGEETDGWDKARQQKRGNIQRLRDILDEQLEYVEGLLPEERTSKTFDGLSKIAALVERVDKMEETIRNKAIEEAAEVVEKTARERGDSEEDIKFWQEKVLGIR